ncbi:MAG: CHASE domain-containing protein, partial [Oxalicibacterium faecigallinarum]|nr:CHASE domain-containing protein [Oxalicibacterium faecigallinarum]
MQRSHFSPSMAALLTLIVGLMISVILFISMRRLAHDNVDTEFHQHAKVRVAAIQDGINSSIDVLRDVNQLFVAFGDVSREQFKEFSAPLLERNPYIQALNYHRILSDDERDAYEAQMRERYPNFVITERDKQNKLLVAARRPMYRVVDYIEPMAGNEGAFGFDADHYSFQTDAMQRSVDTGQPSATGLLPLVQEVGKQSGFIVLMPVYRQGAVLTDVASRRAAVIGDTAAVFACNDLIKKSLTADSYLLATDNQKNINVSVYAAPTSDPKALIYGTGELPIDSPSVMGLPTWLFYDHPEAYVRAFDVAGKKWSIVVSTPPHFFVGRNDNALWALLVGVLFSFGAAGYLQMIVTRSRRIQMLVDERTMQLRTANQDLVADIAARKHAEQELQLRDRAIEASANAIIITSAEGPDYGIEYVNPAFERITGYAEEEALGRNIDFLWQRDSEQPGIEELRACLQEQREGQAVMRNYRKDGTLLWSDMYIAPVRDDYGRVSHYVIAQYDITATKRYESELEFQTNRDSLTGLANRTLLRDRLSQAISYAYRYNHPIWVLFIDLDRFKFVNDTLGHQAGDILLKAVASRMNSVVRDTDTISRMGGDEFVVVLPERMDSG